MLNLWWPSWLTGAAPGTTQYAYYEHVEQRALPDSELLRRHGPAHAIDGSDPLDGKATGLQRAGFEDRAANQGHTLTIDSAATQFFNTPALTNHRVVTLTRPPTGRYIGQRIMSSSRSAQR